MGWVWSLVGELRSCMLHDVWQKINGDNDGRHEVKCQSGMQIWGNVFSAPSAPITPNQLQFLKCSFLVLVSGWNILWGPFLNPTNNSFFFFFKILLITLQSPNHNVICSSFNPFFLHCFFFPAQMWTLTTSNEYFLILLWAALQAACLQHSSSHTIG